MNQANFVVDIEKCVGCGKCMKVRPDMFFCGAPHILIPHAPLGHGEPIQDVVIAGY